MNHIAFGLTSLALSTCVIAQDSPSVVEFDVPGAHVILANPIVRWTGDTDLAEKGVKSSLNGTGCFTKKTKTTKYESSCRNWFGLGGVQTPGSILVDQTLLEARKINPDFEYSAPSSGNNLTVNPEVNVSPVEFNAIQKAQSSLAFVQYAKDGDPSTLTRRIKVSKFFQDALDTSLSLALGVKSGLGLTTGFVAAQNIGVPDLAKALIPKIQSSLAPISLPKLEEPEKFSSVDIRRLDLFSPGQGQLVIAYTADKSADVEMTAISTAIAIALQAPKDLVSIRQRSYAERVNFWNQCRSDAQCFELSK